MILTDIKFNLGQILYLKTDTGQVPRILVEVSISINNMRYCLACGSSTSWHYDFEISAEKDVLATINSAE